MISNIGSFDRIIRLVVGIFLIAAPFLTQFTFLENITYRYLSIVLGIILLLTSLVKFCPIYRILGIGTRRA